MTDALKVLAPVVFPAIFSAGVAVLRLLDPVAARRRRVRSDFETTAVVPTSLAFKKADLEYREQIADITSSETTHRAAVIQRIGNIFAVGGLAVAAGIAAYLAFEFKADETVPDLPKPFMWFAGVLYAAALGSYTTALVIDSKKVIGAR